MAIEVTLPPQGLDQAALRLSLLGGFRAERAGRVISDVGWERPSGKTLVKLLATFPGHRLHREEALDLLWPDLAPDSAAASLRKALHYARHALEPELPAKGQSQYLTLHDDLLALTGSYSVDADDFENLAQHALQSGRMVDYAAALATYRGELLPEDRYAEWAISRREHLASLHLRVLMGTAAELEQRGAYGEAVSRLSLALCQDPCHEEAHRRLIHLYARMGSRHEALRQYQMCREALRRELGVEPEGATQELYQEGVNNALRHSQANAIRLCLGVCGASVLLEVVDDGQGFAVPPQLDSLALDGHLGLASVHQRVERAGGQLAVLSVQGEGTTLRVTLPVTESDQ